MRKNVKLYQIAHSRTGDKFDASLISVLPYDRAHLDLLRDVLTPEYVQTHFQDIVRGHVEREETHYGFIFVLHAALDGGVVAGLRHDKHGKSLSGYMLEIDIPVSLEFEVPRDIAR
ncbi:hypothetical protein ACFOGJ_03770 [Marinibaculum pumilum]|uniref:AtuA-like ferredoxin-fold domain-containing protein n=1 Tax=Marinibaculum pumilum TaxID=1766165 RepID=A0ABV7KVJ5_9PROT